MQLAIFFHFPPVPGWNQQTLKQNHALAHGAGERCRHADPVHLVLAALVGTRLILLGKDIKRCEAFLLFLCVMGTQECNWTANCVCKFCCIWRYISLDGQIWKAFHFTVIVEIRHKVFPVTNLVETIFLSPSFLLYLMYILWLCCLWSFAVWVGWLSSLYVKLNFKDLQLFFYTKG